MAGIAYGTKSNTTKVGGTLVLTDQRVIFEPLKLSTALVPGSDRRWIAGYFFDMELGEVTHAARDDAYSQLRAAIAGAT